MNLFWKALLIVGLTVFAALYVYPPEEKLKPGLDLAGGTSLVYEIDISQLSAEERDNIAENMIPILRRRVDPTNMANLVMRPQGNNRIEIQLPLASKETRQRREAYDQALRELERENVNLSTIKLALSFEPTRRQEVLQEFIGDSQEKEAVIEKLIEINKRLEADRQQENKFQNQMDRKLDQLEQAGLDRDTIIQMAPSWAKQNEQQRRESLKTFIDNNKPEGQLTDVFTQLIEGKTQVHVWLEEYVEAYKQWSEIANRINQPETGLQAQYDQAFSELRQFTLSMEQLISTLEMPENKSGRQPKLDDIKNRFPDRVDEIEKVEQTFDEYRAVRGRLDDPEDLKRMLRGAGVLEFRIIPTLDELSQSEISMYRQRLETLGPRAAGDDEYVWLPVEDPQAWGAQNSITHPFGDQVYVLASNQDDESLLQGEDEWRLTNASPGADEAGRRAIYFEFNTIGSNLFYEITQDNTGRLLGIVLDDIVISAPGINEPIWGSGIIKGRYNQTEQQDMINKLRAGSLKARLSEVPISEKSIGALIGADNRDQGIKAGLIGLALVAAFMAVYYIGSGVIADLALVLNMLFILAFMAMLEATFTLPGIAGLILTIGMSVDANVLIFERIREEQQSGSSLRTAVANGYQRAFRTIFDANITTFITALILFMVASEEIKGFAIVLMLGIASSMFTALFVTRVIFDILLDKKIIRDHLAMMQIVREPKINWMKLRPVFFVISLVLVVGGIYAFFARDEEQNSKYDIEFTGGTSVQIDLIQNAGLSRADVEQQVTQTGMLEAARVTEVGQTGSSFEITTTTTNNTVAVIELEDEGKTPLDVQAAIQKTADKSANTLANLRVEAIEGNPDQFRVQTSQVNDTVVREIINNTFGNARIVSIEVNEVVSDTVRETFAGLLSTRENLGAEIVSTDKVDGSMMELFDYIGGIRIETALDTPVTGSELKTRFKEIRFKPDMQNLSWYRYDILTTDHLELKDDEIYDRFAYVSVDPEAGIRELDQQEWEKYVDNERQKILNATSLESTLSRVTQIDPSIGEEAKTRAMYAIILSLLAIVGYIWVRFGTARYGFAAIAALVHDVCIALGAVVCCTWIAKTPIGEALLISDFKINLELIAAFLTIIGYSLNDTIVVFDRIRENRGKSLVLYPSMISQSINQTLSRTLLTSFTTFLVVLVMYIWGGAGLRGFTFAMLIGILAGTYSSIAIAAPILVIGKKSSASA